MILSATDPGIKPCPYNRQYTEPLRANPDRHTHLRYRLHLPLRAPRDINAQLAPHHPRRQRPFPLLQLIHIVRVAAKIARPHQPRPLLARHLRELRIIRPARLPPVPEKALVGVLVVVVVFVPGAGGPPVVAENMSQAI